MKVEETHASQSSSSSPQKIENILVCQVFFIVKLHTRGPNPLLFSIKNPPLPAPVGPTCL